MLNSGQGSVKPRFQLDETVPAKSMTKPLTDFRTGHRTVSFRMTSTVTGFFFAVFVMQIGGICRTLVQKVAVERI